MHSWGMTDQQDYSQVLKVSRDASKAFFDRVSCTIPQLRAETARRQSYGDGWQYAWNPLEATPLVCINPAHPDWVMCPIQRYLIRRVSAGIFFDLVKSSGFDNPYGNAFQAYVGQVLEQTCPPPRFTVLAEQPYTIGTDLHHGVDWIVSDTTGHLFIECKTKRLTLDAKTLSDAVALDRDLVVMATAIVQHYGNIRRAIEGKTRWVPDGLPIYPMVLTLEDWYLFSPRVSEMLKGHVDRLSALAGIPVSMFEEMPWVIASSHEFEIATQVMARVGIDTVMKGKVRPEHRAWSLLPFVLWNFPDEMKQVNRRLFPDDWDRLIPDKLDWEEV